MPSFPAVPQNVGRSIMTVTIWAKLGLQDRRPKWNDKKIVEFSRLRGLSRCPSSFLFVGIFKHVQKMAHSAQLNIKVDPLFSLAVVGWGCRCSWLSLHLSGCRVSWPWPGVVPLDRVLQAWPGVVVPCMLPVGRAGFRGLDFLV